MSTWAKIEEDEEVTHHMDFRVFDDLEQLQPFAEHHGAT